MKHRTIQFAARCAAATILLSLTLPGADENVLNTKARRGVSPTGTYAAGGIDSIDTASGNLSVRIPITTLPVARGGQSTGLELVYNSAIYDIRQEIQPRFTPQVDVVVNELQTSLQGGWRYNPDGYGLHFEDRATLNGSFTCSSAPETWRRTRMYFVTPDGAMRVLRRRGYSDTLGDGFYAWTPDNTANICRAPGSDLPVPNGDPVYFTTDGSWGSPRNGSGRIPILIHLSGERESRLGRIETRDSPQNNSTPGSNERLHV